MAKYRLIHGEMELLGRTLKAGVPGEDIVESESPLDGIFRNKFSKLDVFEEPALAPAPAPASVPSPVTEPASVDLTPPDPDAPATHENPEPVAKEEEPTPKASPSRRVKGGARGREVTNLFPEAIDEDFRVFKKRTHYYIYNVDDMDAPVNKNGVPKDKVVATILEALEG